MFRRLKAKCQEESIQSFKACDKDKDELVLTEQKRNEERIIKLWLWLMFIQF